MDYDKDTGHSLQIYLLCAAIHLMSILSLAFTYHNEHQLILHMNDMFHIHVPNIQYISLRNEGPARSFLV